MTDLNLRQVSYLLAVIDEGHFGRAAEKLFISPPALTQQVRKLERSLGVDLIDRSAHPLRPTPVGVRFVAEARQAVAAAQRAVAATRQPSQRLRVGFMTAAIDPHAREFLTRLREQNPSTAVDLVELPWSQTASAVRRAEVDATLMRPPVLDDTGLRFDVLCTEDRVVAMARDHRLATRESLTIDDLDGEIHVCDDAADTEWVRWWACDPRPSGAEVIYGQSVQTMDELLEAVASSREISITSENVPITHRHPYVVFVPLTGVEPSELCLCTRMSDTSEPINAAQQIVRKLREEINFAPTLR